MHLGLLAPVVITMTILLQRMGLGPFSWDEPLSTELNSSWNKIVKDFFFFNNLHIPRIVVCDSYKKIRASCVRDRFRTRERSCI